MCVCVIKMSDVIPILAIVIIAYLRFSTTFILQNDCLVSSPCTCFDSYDGIDIRCSSRDLTNIPDIKQFSANVDKINLFFCYNKLTVIQNDTFRNLSSINANDIDLQLQGNMIHTIESNAFNGIAKTIKSLQLQSNNITILPFAIKYLVNLKRLDICDNPLHSLDTLVMHNIGRSLTYFSFDLDTFTKWPKELHYLRVLESLIANHIPYPQLDVNVFHGFESTLRHLTLDYSKLKDVPNAICHLSQLTSFTFRFAYHLQTNISSTFAPCTQTNSTVFELNLASSNIHTFPNVFTLFPFLSKLNILNNSLEYIESTKIPTSTELTSLSLQYNRFERIPYALNLFKRLKQIFLYGNKIKTIETPDLSGLFSLIVLNLFQNPISYIAPDAFYNNINLYYLDLDYTRLDHVPVAVTFLTKLRYLYLSGMPIDCTCDMSYLKHWNVSSVNTFSTKCASSSETVKHFIMTSLQTCQ
ncbi:leucine-rich repeat-containing protein let-4-like [Ruditapes philippinarum]|uniref:leucine-rich repeat-containing protein let-4-like n=1 Tax=Ruditapes philippinarum TaxID=129788 RepID=UPI00295BAC57|nr:leucine-rich repeat-containing protein let-4-like [Ruditapes philippinarum]